MSTRTREFASGGDDTYTYLRIPAVPLSGEITGPAGRAVDDLPPVYADVIRMTYGEMLSAPEIARLTGLTPGSVRQYRARAMQLLRERQPMRVRHYPQDQMKYNRGTVKNILGYALDPDWDGQVTSEGEQVRNRNKAPNEGGDGMVMVLDVRRALGRLPQWVEQVLRGKSTEGSYDDALRAVLDYLNGFDG